MDGDPGEQATRELDDLLYAVGHDLREPLRAILGFSQLLADQYRAGLDSTGQDYLDRISRAATRLDGQIQSLLTLSRARRFAVPSAPTEIESLVRGAIGRLTSSIVERRGTVRVAAGLGRAVVNPTWMATAIDHLILNGLTFVRPGEVPDLEIGPWSDGPAATGLVVRDRGPGVEPEHAERIFRPFQRAGCGLAVVRAVAERHGGRAWTSPRPGGGSEFVVTFGPDPGTRAHLSATVAD